MKTFSLVFSIIVAVAVFLSHKHPEHLLQFMQPHELPYVVTVLVIVVWVVTTVLTWFSRKPFARSFNDLENGVIHKVVSLAILKDKYGDEIVYMWIKLGLHVFPVKVRKDILRVKGGRELTSSSRFMIKGVSEADGGTTVTHYEVTMVD